MAIDTTSMTTSAATTAQSNALYLYGNIMFWLYCIDVYHRALRNFSHGVDFLDLIAQTGGVYKNNVFHPCTTRSTKETTQPPPEQIHFSAYRIHCVSATSFTVCGRDRLLHSSLIQGVQQPPPTIPGFT
jgi:hypothetical protein